MIIRRQSSDEAGEPEMAGQQVIQHTGAPCEVRTTNRRRSRDVFYDVGITRPGKGNSTNLTNIKASDPEPRLIKQSLDFHNRVALAWADSVPGRIDPHVAIKVLGSHRGASGGSKRVGICILRQVGIQSGYHSDPIPVAAAVKVHGKSGVIRHSVCALPAAIGLQATGLLPVGNGCVLPQIRSSYKPRPTGLTSSPEPFTALISDEIRG
ncbi:hypothetical protein QBC47DRAFT_169605 [Echria macrotheca]|uniref:Uncharacterized protein n=1 Tax=Echria macrotheca TaxID=438768 RepID=A0AAJ0BJ38_9PEZI|nr:hypothetical protein QBC47DRAFT_169605 [Echria macrotheca]